MSTLHDRVRVGIVQFMAYPDTMGGEGPVLESIGRIARDDFFGAVEVTCINDPETRRRAAEMLAQSGLEVGFGAQPVQLRNGLDLNAFDETVRRAAVERLAALLPEAAALGAKKFGLLSGPDPGAAGRDAAIGLLADSLVELCRHAAGYGIEVVLEVFDRDIDKKALIGATADAVRVAEAVKRHCANFGLLIDLSHLPLQGETAAQSLAAARDHLSYVHIGNCLLADPHDPLYGDRHPRFGYPGSEIGVAELTDFLRQLHAIGYLGAGAPATVVFEVKPVPGEDPELLIAHSQQTLRQAWASL